MKMRYVPYQVKTSACPKNKKGKKSSNFPNETVVRTYNFLNILSLTFSFSESMTCACVRTALRNNRKVYLLLQKIDKNNIESEMYVHTTS